MKDQSTTFAPSSAAFAVEARNVAEAIELRNKPRLPAPKYVSGKLSPFEMLVQRKWAENHGRAILYEGVGLDQFKRLSHLGQLPAGATWVSTLGVIFGPRPQTGEPQKDAA